MTTKHHRHVWVMTSPHPFGYAINYKCTSCSATKREARR